MTALVICMKECIFGMQKVLFHIVKHNQLLCAPFLLGVIALGPVEFSLAGPPADFSQTKKIIQASMEGYQVYLPLAEENVVEVESDFGLLLDTMLHYQGQLSSENGNHIASQEIFWTLLYVTPTGVLEVQVGDGWLSQNEQYLALSPAEFSPIRSLLEKGQRQFKRFDSDAIAAEVTEIYPLSVQAQAEPEGLADKDALNETASDNSSDKIQKVKVRKVTMAKASSSTAGEAETQPQAVDDTVKSVDVVIGAPESQNRSGQKVEIVNAKGYGDKAKSLLEPSDSTERKGMSEADLQLLYTVLGLGVMIAVVVMLNRYVNRKK